METIAFNLNCSRTLQLNIHNSSRFPVSIVRLPPALTNSAQRTPGRRFSYGLRAGLALRRPTCRPRRRPVAPTAAPAPPQFHLAPAVWGGIAGCLEVLSPYRRGSGVSGGPCGRGVMRELRLTGVILRGSSSLWAGRSVLRSLFTATRRASRAAGAA